MKIDGWQYYNHAAIPTCAPNEFPNLKPIEDGTIWKIDGGIPLLARWTTDWNCGYKTEWWYTILDHPFDIMEIKHHYRTQIRKGLKHFSCRRIFPAEYAADMAQISLRDFETYPKSYRPSTTYEKEVQNFKRWKKMTWGAFNEENKLCAFNGCTDHGTYISLDQSKSLPEWQKYELNAALIYTVLNSLSSELHNGKFISNGQRNLYHITNYNEDLCRKFGFHKAYCNLRVVLNPKIKQIIRVCVPYSKTIYKFNKYSLFHKLGVVLKMLEIMGGG